MNTRSNAMPLTIKKSVKDMFAEANAAIETLNVDQAKALLGTPGVTFIDLRDPREIWRDGGMPGAINAARHARVLDRPGQPYHKDFFASATASCSSARPASAPRWRRNGAGHGAHAVCHIEGGFGAWKKAGGRSRRSSRSWRARVARRADVDSARRGAGSSD
jgi:rhodanese-related sulfurtransferase